MAPASTVRERVSHGFQVSGLLQYYSTLPFNITSGLTTIQGSRPQGTPCPCGRKCQLLPECSPPRVQRELERMDLSFCSELWSRRPDLNG